MVLKKLTKTLNEKDGLKDWAVTQRKRKRTEAYLIQNGSKIDVERISTVKETSTNMSVFVDHGESLGEFSAKVSKKTPLAQQVDEAVDEAANIHNPLWSLPEPEEIYPSVQTADPEILSKPQECMDKIVERIRESVATQEGVIFNNAEIFLTGTELEIQTSKKFLGKKEKSQIYLEIAFSRHEEDGRSDEMLKVGYATSFKELDVEKFVTETAEAARNMTQVEMPVTGQYNVIVDAGVISQLFHGLVSQTSGGFEFYKYPHKKVGDKLV